MEYGNQRSQKLSHGLAVPCRLPWQTGETCHGYTKTRSPHLYVVAVSQRLLFNAAANHNSAHIGQNYRTQGKQAQKIKKALIAVDRGGLSDKFFSLDDKYDTTLALYVRAFRNDHGILNHAGNIDMICGIQTIRALDTPLC